jgi:anaerobic magnesium-protoporphyrin IX monomethyl ester cyclase
LKVVLVNLSHPGIRPEDEEEHLGLGYLAAVARRAGHDAEIIDGTLERLPPPRLARLCLERAGPGGPAALIGVSVIFQESLPAAMSLVAELRRGGFEGHIVLGGHPPTFVWRELCREHAGFDSVAVGEAEETFNELLASLDAGRDWTGIAGLVDAAAARQAASSQASATAAAGHTRRPLVADLDTLPFPARDTLPAFIARSPGARVASVLRSRGCYGSCSFCDTRSFYAASPGSAWRVRSAASVTDEIEALVRDHGIQAIRFWDDNFMGPGQRGHEAAEALARELIRRQAHGLPAVRFSFECRVTDVEADLFHLLKKAGLGRLFLGVEAMTQRQLDYFDKKVTVADNRRALVTLEELGLEVVIGMIMFDPETTVEELNTNLAFLKESFGAWGSVKSKVAAPWNRLEVYAGTPLEATLREQGRLKGDYAGYDYDFTDPTVARIYAGGSALRKVGLPIRDAVNRLRRRP